MLSEGLLTDFMSNFFGYGDLRAPLWFVGMEEGGGNTEAEVQARIDAWVARGRPQVDDVEGFHRAFGEPKWFDPRAPTQSTWRPIIRSILIAKGAAFDIEAIRAYQINRFARTRADIASLELMPLPSPSTSASGWRYGNWSDSPLLRDRRTYKSEVMPGRIARLRALLLQHKPRAVVFYGASYQPYWEQVSGCTFGTGALPRVAQRAATIFLVRPHPTAGPSGNPPTPGAAHFIAAGKTLKQHLSNL